MAIVKCEKSPAEELCVLFGEEFDGDDGMDAMIARLAARFGIDKSKLRPEGSDAPKCRRLAESHLRSHQLYW